MATVAGCLKPPGYEGDPGGPSSDVYPSILSSIPVCVPSESHHTVAILLITLGRMMRYAGIVSSGLRIQRLAHLTP